MVHILSEVVVVVGLTFYFNQKNKKLMAHIEDLAQRVEEQEDLLQKHDQIIQQLVDHIGKQQAMMQRQAMPPSQLVSVGSPTRPKAHAKSGTKSGTRSRTRSRVKSPPPVRVHFAPDPVDTKEESEEETEDDLDAELVEELNDLVEPDDNLKKGSQLKKDA